MPSLTYCNDLNIKNVRLKNGASVFYLDQDFPGVAGIINIFLKNGSTLKFKNKTGLASVSQNLLVKQLKKVAQKTGFNFKTWLEWDYLSVTIYIPESISSTDLDEVISIIFGGGKIQEKELEDTKKTMLQMMKNSIARKYIDYPLASFMVHHSSIYSKGMIGDAEDIQSVTAKEIEDFMSCYYTINNSIVSVSDKKYFKRLRRILSKLKPCFKDTEYSVEKFATVDLPRRIVRHVKSGRNYDAVRIGFLSNACDKKKNAVYDLVAQIIVHDPELVAMANYVYAENICYRGLGVFELNMSGPISRGNPDISVTKALLRLSELGSNIEELQVNNAKKELEKKYKKVLNDKDATLYALSKALVLCEDKKCFSEYLYTMKKTRIEDIKRVLHDFSEERSIKLFIKMEQ